MTKPDVNSFGMEGGGVFMEAAEQASEELVAKVEAEQAEDEEESEEETGEEDEAEESEDLEDEDEEESEDESDSEEDEEEDEEESDADDEQVEAKEYKVTLDDGSQIELKDNATIKIKEDGKFKRVAVKDLISDHNGRIKHDELIRRNAETKKELSTKLEEIESDNERIKAHTKRFTESMSKGDLIPALGVIAELSGSKDVNSLVTELLNGMGHGLDRISKMSEEELKKEAEAYKIDSQLKQKKGELSEIERQQAVKRTVEKKKQYCEQYDIEEELVDAAYHSLVKAGRDPEKMTLEDVVATAVESIHFGHIEEIRSGHELELDQGDINNLVDLANIELRKNKYKKLGKKDYVRIVSRYANKELEETLSRKVGKKKKTTPKRKKKKSKAKTITRPSQVWE